MSHADILLLYVALTILSTPVILLSLVFIEVLWGNRLRFNLIGVSFYMIVAQIFWPATIIADLILSVCYVFKKRR